MFLGDCLEVMPTLQRKAAAMAFCDLPYGVTGFEWDQKLELKSFYASLEGSLLSKGPVVATANESFAFALREAWKKTFRYMLIWDKQYRTGAFHAHSRPMVSHEFVVIAGPTPTYNPQKSVGHRRVRKTGEKIVGDFTPDLQPLRRGRRLDLDDTRNPGSIITFSRDKRVRRSPANGYAVSTHPSQKPVGLLDWLVRTYSNAGETVLDPCAGSGTTACAALLSGRNAVCIEKDEGYFDASVERVRKTIADNNIRADFEVRR